MVAVFYRSVVQVVLLFVLDTWLIFTAMDIMVEGDHTGFLVQITGERAQQKLGST